ncbi:MAG: hypothetical protein Q8Q29_03990 [Actinomycetota bacterium]|nr:hypothetical protein [Actinomycetota bacterium]
MSARCPDCGGRSAVTETRTPDKPGGGPQNPVLPPAIVRAMGDLSNFRWRRRTCTVCEGQWDTVEVVFDELERALDAAVRHAVTSAERARIRRPVKLTVSLDVEELPTGEVAVSLRDDRVRGRRR